MKTRVRILIIVVVDFLFIPITIISSIWLKVIRTYNVGLFGTISQFSKIIFNKIGVFPITDNYYEPFFQTSKLKQSLRDDRKLSGINFNEAAQLELLKKFNYNNELIEIGKLPRNELTYSFSEGPFRSGDSETLFNMVRYYKPKKIIEIGCGHSSLMIQHAIHYNSKEDKNYYCEHVCIEPYENAWLLKLNVQVVRKKVEEMDSSFFQSLENNDLLFIDSTHIIKPQGDVLFEYLQILPIIKSGVLVHIHDIFSPKDYLDQWVKEGVNFWNEQYLLEAFLSCNTQFKIICAVNFLKHKYFDELIAKSPFLT